MNKVIMHFNMFIPILDWPNVLSPPVTKSNPNPNHELNCSVYITPWVPASYNCLTNSVEILLKK